jgi:sugar-specific transcriptional regulator TrmB
VNEAEVVERLNEFGLDDRQARAYYHLARMGPSTASELSDATGVSRSQVYSVMDGLEEVGVVDRTLERPRRYVPRPVEEVLEETLDEERRRLDRLEETSEDLVKRWPSADHDNGGRQERYSVHEGRSQVSGVLQRTVEEAEDELALVAPRRGVERLDAMGVVDELVEADDRGVDVRLLTRVDETQGRRAALRRLDEAGEVRHVDVPEYNQFAVADTDQVALFVSLDPMASAGSGKETVLWLNARDHVIGRKAVVERLWSQGISLEDRAAELEGGAPAERARAIRGRWMRYDRARAMVGRADETVRLAAPAAELERLPEADLDRALERAAADGVDVAVLAPAEADVDLDGPAVRSTPAVDGLSLLVVDGEEALVGLAPEREPGSATCEEDWNLWSSSPTFVEHVERELAARSTEPVRTVEP